MSSDDDKEDREGARVGVFRRERENERKSEREKERGAPLSS